MWAQDWLAKRAALSPSRVALVDNENGQSFSYHQWNQQVNQTANFLLSLGCEKGDRVAVLSYNCIAYLDLWLACGKLGLILQNINWRLKPREIVALVEDARPKVLVYGPDFPESVAALRELSFIKRCVSLATSDAQGKVVPFQERDELPTSLCQPPAVAEQDPWVICYTGGSTGLPKGALLTHRSITANAINTVLSWQLDANDTAILNAPLFHTGALNVFTAPLVYVGGCSVVCREFSSEQFFGLVAAKRANLFFGVPTMFTMLQQDSAWHNADFSHFKFIISGGAPCPLPVFEKFWKKGVDFKTGYGLTEAGPNNFWLPPELVQQKPGAVGFPLFYVKAKLVNDKQQEITEDDIPGELCLQGPHVMAGYWNNPEATAQALDSEGWLHTGDLAKRDKDGSYAIVGRVKDMIISGGENIYPAEIESVLYQHPAVKEAAVIGVADDKWGEVPQAFLSLKEGHEASEAELKAHCKALLASYKVPKIFTLLADLPKTGAGKVDRKLLQQ